MNDRYFEGFQTGLYTERDLRAHGVTPEQLLRTVEKEYQDEMACLSGVSVDNPEGAQEAIDLLEGYTAAARSSLRFLMVMQNFDDTL